MKTKHIKNITAFATVALFAPWASAQTIYDTDTQDPLIGTNAADIATNAADIASNDTDIATNAADIASNDTDIATNAADIATNDTDIATNAADIATNAADIATEVADRSELIRSTGTNGDGNQIVHIGDNSLVTQELGGEQQLHAEDASGNAIDIVVTNGSDLIVRTQDPAATNSNIGINSGLLPQIVDPDPTDSVVPVVTTRDGIGAEKIDFTNSGVTIAQNGDVTLLQSAGTQLNVELGTVTSFDVDADTGVPIPGSQRWVAGYYTDTDGNIVNVSDFAAAVLADPTTAGDYTFIQILDPRFTSIVDEDTLITQLQAIEPDDAVFTGITGADGQPLVASTTLPGTGGNLQVGGNANVDGVLSLAAGDPDGVADSGDEWDAVANVAEAIGDNETAIDAEETARIAADGVLQDNIDAEETARIAADGVLQDNIDAEETARIAADGVLQDNIDAEETARIAADGVLQDNIDAEETARIAADGVLQDNIDAEETARIAADEVLQDNIDAEVSTRSALIRREGDGFVHIGENSLIFDDTNPGFDQLTSSKSNLIIGGGATTDVAIDANLDVAGDASFQQDVFVAGDIFVGGRTQGLQKQIDNNREDIDRNARGIAMVAALQHTTVLPDMKHALDLSAAHFEGETGMALNYARRINDNVQINFGAASTSDFDESVIKAGIGVQW